MGPFGSVGSTSEPVYCDFASTTVDVPEDVSTLWDAVQALADVVGILGFTVRSQRAPFTSIEHLLTRIQLDELAGLTSTSTTLDHRDKKRFDYAWANNCTERLKKGTMVPLRQFPRPGINSYFTRGQWRP